MITLETLLLVVFIILCVEQKTHSRKYKKNLKPHGKNNLVPFQVTVTQEELTVNLKVTIDVIYDMQEGVLMRQLNMGILLYTTC